MSITYFANFCAPISKQWYIDRGLLAEDGSIKTYFAGGRIDIHIRDDSVIGHDSWDEYAVPPMHAEDLGEFSQWLNHHVTPYKWSYDDIVNTFENKRLKRKIRWG